MNLQVITAMQEMQDAQFGTDTDAARLCTLASAIKFVLQRLELVPLNSS